MQQSIENKTDIKNKILNFYNLNKIKIYTLIFILLIILISAAYLKYDSKKKNDLIAEKYIQAGIYIALNKKDEAKVLYEEIILSKNKFYSILALNSIIENELEENSAEILKLFEVIENINITKEQKNLVKLKKALYLKKISKDKEGNKLLKEIIADNSIWKEAAMEVSNN